MKAMVAGLTASGKTSLSRAVARRTGVDYISGSALRAEYLGLPHSEPLPRRYWLEDPAALAADRERLRAGAAERDFDAYLAKRFSRASDGVFDVWFLPWLSPELGGIKVYVDAPFDLRVARAALQSPDFDAGAIATAIRAKDARAIEYASSVYRVDITSDATPFDIIVRSNADASPDALAIAIEQCTTYRSAGPTPVTFNIEIESAGRVGVHEVERGSDEWRLRQS